MLLFAENVNGDFRFLDRINHFHSHIHFRSMFWAATAQTVAQCAAACAGDGSMYLIAIYLFAFQVGIMPAGSLHRTRCTMGRFLLWNNGIIYAEIYRLFCFLCYRQNGLEALLTLYRFYLFVSPFSFGQEMPIGGSMSYTQFAAMCSSPTTDFTSPLRYTIPKAIFWINRSTIRVRRCPSGRTISPTPSPES